MTRRITKVVQQGRNRHRYDIYLDGELAFSVHEEVLISLRLLKGKELTKSQLERIAYEEERKKIERDGLRYLSHRPRTEWELKRHLQEKGFSEALVDAVLRRWIEQGYVNDQAYALQWARERLQIKRKGSLLIQHELRAKGIAEEIIQDVLQSIPQEEELCSCLALAQKKWHRFAQWPPLKRMQKLMAYLSQRGYPYDVISEVCRQLDSCKEESQAE